MSHRRRVRVLILLSTLLVVAQPLVAVTGASGAPETSAGATEGADDRSDRAIRALRDDAQGKVFVSKRESTGVAGFIRTGASGDLLPDSAATTAGGKAQGFFARFGETFGITDASEMELAS